MWFWAPYHSIGGVGNVEDIGRGPPCFPGRSAVLSIGFPPTPIQLTIPSPPGNRQLPFHSYLLLPRIEGRDLTYCLACPHGWSDQTQPFGLDLLFLPDNNFAPASESVELARFWGNHSLSVSGLSPSEPYARGSIASIKCTGRILSRRAWNHPCHEPICPNPIH